MNSAIQVIHTIASLRSAGGGPSQTVTHLTDALAHIPDMSVTLLCQGKPRESVVAGANPTVIRRVLTSSSTLALKMGLPMRKALREWPVSARPAVIHDNGLWLPVNHWAACAARRWNIPLIIQPHGMLAPWARNHKAWKKRLVLTLYQLRDLATARILVATSQMEYENLRAFGVRQPIAVIPNGVHLIADARNIASLRQEVSYRTVLFLGRIYPVKGLLNLIEAWAQLRPLGWRLQIAGPDESGHLAEVMARVKQLGLTDSVIYMGEVEGAAKAALYQAADLFVLPSFTENFGVVVAEALAHGLPVITTHGTPWEDLVTYDCGWWIPIGVAPLIEALRTAMALSDIELNAMGLRGKHYVRRYDWGQVAEQTASIYRWLLGKTEKPNSIYLD